MRGKLLVLVLLITLPVLVSAQAKHITVLSVAQNNATVGGVADVFLEVQPGQGRVYFDSYPLTKLDTQLSTRYAKAYACQLSTQDCSTLDFFYVIRAQSSLIGGPSAGAALTALTYAAIEDLPLNNKIVMTGTVSSGGIIGPVGGTIAKVAAASDRDFSTVLISAIEEEDISSTGIEVARVPDVETAIWLYTGKDIRLPQQEIPVPVTYQRQMEVVAQTLCDRANNLEAKTENVSNISKQYLERAFTASAQGKHYTAASYCFSSLLEVRTLDFQKKDQSDLRGVYRAIEEDIDKLILLTEGDVSRVSNLEVVMIVRERLVDARRQLSEQDYNNLSAQGLAYAHERVNSALVWSSFFDTIPSNEVQLTPSDLRASCSAKLLEAEERTNFLTQLFEFEIEDIREEIDTAYKYRADEEYALCLFSAAKAKAEAEAVMHAAYTGEQLNASINIKLDKAKRIIAKQTVENTFPILSYAYQEYAGELSSIYSRNLYTEYAIEFASLDFYFPQKRTAVIIDEYKVLLLFVGFVLGLTLGVLLTEVWHRHKRKRRK